MPWPSNKSKQVGNISLFHFRMSTIFRSCNDARETPLHLAAGSFKKDVGLELVHELMNAGADMSARNDAGENALHYAMKTGTPAVLRLLLLINT